MKKEDPHLNAQKAQQIERASWEALEDLKQQSQEQFEEILKEKEASEKDEDKEEKLNLVLDAIAREGYIPAKLLKLEDEQIESLYLIAHNFYIQAHYKQALAHFQFLLKLNPQDSRFLFSAAACYQNLEQYKQAVTHYQAASLADPKDPSPYFYLSDCFLHLYDIDSAIDSLSFCIEFAKKLPRKYKDLLGQAKLLRSSFRKQRKIFKKNVREKQKDLPVFSSLVEETFFS